MVASAAQLEANRRNALKSTGPRTPEGKERSRANGLKHGLTAVVCRTPIDQKAAEEWSKRCPEAARSSALDASWLAEEVAVITDRIERIGKIDRRNRDRAALRAAVCWDEDRKRDAEILGAQLAKRPAEVVSKLEETPHGCDWLIGRWAMLARLSDLNGGWEEPARTLAFDLLGTPMEVRAGDPGQSIDAQGRPIEDGVDTSAVARGQIERLEAIRDEILHIDEFDRESTLTGVADDQGAEARRLRAYEGALYKRLRWYLERLEEGMPSPAAAPAPVEAQAAVEPPAAPGPAPTPDAAEPTEEAADTPASEAVAFNRQQLKARKVERRRLAAERKLARRLA